MSEMLTVSRLQAVLAEIEKHRPPWPFDWPVDGIIAAPSLRPFLTGLLPRLGGLFVQVGDRLYLRDWLDAGRLKSVVFIEGVDDTALFGIKKGSVDGFLTGADISTPQAGALDQPDTAAAE